MRKNFWFVVLCLAGLLTAVAFAACGDDDDDDGGDDAAEKAALTEVITTVASTNGFEATQEQIDYYMAHITDGFIQAFGTEDLAACQANAEECIGEPLTNPTVNEEDIEIDGDTAVVTMNSDEGVFGINAIKEEGEWKLGGLFVPDDDIGDAEVVDIELSEFAFIGDLESDTVKSGDFAFHFKNGGQQVHEAVLVNLPAEGELSDLLQDETFDPGEPVLVKLPFAPGDEADVALPAALDPGRYGLVCFLPDTTDSEGTPHAFKGMAAEFTVE